MKKFIAKIMFSAVAVLSVAGFTSCNSNDDNPYVPTPASVQEQAQVLSEARYIAQIPEAAFQYTDITLTLEYNGEKKVFKMDESTKRDNVYFAAMEEGGYKPYMAARVLDIPFQYNSSRMVKATLSYELTEAGKQLIANAVEGEEFDFAFYTAFGKCDKTGKFHYGAKEDNRAFPGTHINEFDSVLAVLLNSNGLCQSL